jgi:ketosteroid isomerase-like protein
MNIVMIAAALAVAAVQDSPPAPSPSVETSADQRALEALNTAWLNSYVTLDRATLSEILADDFVATYGNGRRRTKAELLGGLGQGARILSVRAENLAVHVSGDTAIVTARSVLQIRQGEQTTEARNDYADIYVRRDGRWRAIAAHIVRVPPPAP